MDSLLTNRANILRFIKEKYLFIGTIFLFLLFLSLIFFPIVSPSRNKQTVKAVPTTAPTRSAQATIPEQNEVPYQEQTAKDSGVINFSENGEMATESKKEILSDGSVKYTMDSQNPNRSDIVIVKNGALIFSRHAVVGSDISDGYKNLLGKQDQTFSGPTFYGPDTVIYFYSDGGTALTVNPKTNTVYEEFTFQPPISVNDFNLGYRQYAQ